MLNRGRKSAAELSIIPFEPHLNPQPPAELTDEQASEFDAIVRLSPKGWFGQGSIGLLAAYCQHSSNARMIAAQIAEFKGDWLKAEGGLKRFERLSKLQEAQHRAMAMLASKMKLTQSSKIKLAADAKAMLRNNPVGEQPWDYSEDEAAEG